MAEADEEDNGGRRRGIQSIEIGMRILDALAAAGRAVPLNILAQLTGIAAPQVHRYLQSFIVAGTAKQDPATGHYDLGAGALRIGLAALARTDAFRIVDRVIGDFVERTGQMVQISALGLMGPTIVRLYNGRPALLTTLHVGAVLPLLTSATGRVFLAFAPPSETRAIIEKEMQGPKASASLDEIRVRVRKDGKNVEDGTVIPGLHATAYPIFDLQGRAILVATALVSEAQKSERLEAVEELGECCRLISSELGWITE